jgi:hypothetical protein
MRLITLNGVGYEVDNGGKKWRKRKHSEEV